MIRTGCTREGPRENRLNLALKGGYDRKIYRYAYVGRLCVFNIIVYQVHTLYH